MPDKKTVPTERKPFVQFYKGIRLEYIYRNYTNARARRYTLGGTNQNVWIPCKHLTKHGMIKPGQNIDYVFRKAQRQLVLAGYTEPIPGIKRRTIIEPEVDLDDWI